MPRMEDVRAILARNIKAARKRLTLSQEELAARSGGAKFASLRKRPIIELSWGNVNNETIETF